MLSVIISINYAVIYLTLNVVCRWHDAARDKFLGNVTGFCALSLKGSFFFSRWITTATSVCTACVTSWAPATLKVSAHEEVQSSSLISWRTWHMPPFEVWFKITQLIMNSGLIHTGGHCVSETNDGWILFSWFSVGRCAGWLTVTSLRPYSNYLLSFLSRIMFLGCPPCSHTVPIHCNMTSHPSTPWC